MNGRKQKKQRGKKRTWLFISVDCLWCRHGEAQELLATLDAEVPWAESLAARLEEEVQQKERIQRATEACADWSDWFD